MDGETIACTEYQETKRATFDQVVADIAMLVGQITDLERIETESIEGIAQLEAGTKAVETIIRKGDLDSQRHTV